MERRLAVESVEGDPGLLGRMAEHSVPGLSLAVIDGGRIVCEHAYGVKEAGLPAPATPATRFQACSISKPVTALAMLRLVDRGVLDLDADVNDRLTSWRIPPNGSWQPRVTLRQIVSHTAGLTVHGFPGYARGEPLPTLTQVLTGTAPANTAAVRVDTFPGVQFRYSGGGTCVLQLLLEEISGRDLAELAAELVLSPLGMEHSGFAQPLPEPLHDGAATAHDTDGTPVVGKWHDYPEQAAAGLWTTAGDLARCTIALQAAVAGAPGGILPAPAAAELLTPQTSPRDPIHRLGGLNAVGLGPFLRVEGGRITYFGHAGGNEGFRCHLLAHRDAGVGAAVMTNGEAGAGLIYEVLGAIAREFEWPDYSPGEPPPAPLREPPLDELAGVYELHQGLTMTVERRGDAVDVRVGDQEAIAFVRVSATTLASQVVDATLEQVGSGEIARLVLRQNGEQLAWARSRSALPGTGE